MKVVIQAKDGTRQAIDISKVEVDNKPLSAYLENLAKAEQNIVELKKNNDECVEAIKMLAKKIDKTNEYLVKLGGK